MGFEGGVEVDVKGFSGALLLEVRTVHLVGVVMDAG